MSLLFEVRVVPGSGKQCWMIDKVGRLKCYLKSPPEKGKANDELIRLLSKCLSVPQQNIEIVSGATTRTKRIRIPLALTLAHLLPLLGIEQQLSIVQTKK